MEWNVIGPYLVSMTFTFHTENVSCASELDYLEYYIFSGGHLVRLCMKCWWDIRLSIQMNRCLLVER